MDGAPAAAPAAASPLNAHIGSDGRLTPPQQQQLGSASPASQGAAVAASVIAVPPTRDVSSTGVALLHQELLLYALRRCSSLSGVADVSLDSPSFRGRQTTPAAAAIAAAIPILQHSGFRVGSRVAERLTLKCFRMPEQRECVKFVCKDLWHFLFQKQADRLQTNRRGGYVIHDTSLPWLRRVHPFAAPVSSPSLPDKGADGAFLQHQEEEILRAAATQPQLHVAFVCGAIKGALAALGLECTVTAEAPRPPTCSFQIRIST